MQPEGRLTVCALAPIVVAVALSGPMCPRLDRATPVMAALIGTGEASPDSRVVDPQFEAAIRAPAPKPRKRRRHR